MPPRTVIIVQARMGSSRLPGKVLLPLAGETMLAQQLKRLQRCRRADAIVVATSTAPADDAIVSLLEAWPDILCVRGSEQDVLARYYQAAKQAQADVVVRVTADCPLIEPAVIDACIAIMLEQQDSCDYVSNCQQRSFPRGLDCEVFSMAALETAHQQAHQPAEREHVTPYIWQQPERFRLCDYVDTHDRSDWRLTVDTPEDLALVRRIYHELYAQQPDFHYAQLVALLEANPDWLAINRDVVQKSLET